MLIGNLSLQNGALPWSCLSSLQVPTPPPLCFAEPPPQSRRSIKYKDFCLPLLETGRQTCPFAFLFMLTITVMISENVFLSVSTRHGCGTHPSVPNCADPILNHWTTQFLGLVHEGVRGGNTEDDWLVFGPIYGFSHSIESLPRSRI